MPEEKVTCKIYKLSQAGRVYMSETVIDFDSFMAMMLTSTGFEIVKGKIVYEYEFWSGKHDYEGCFATTDFITFVY